MNIFVPCYTVGNKIEYERKNKMKRVYALYRVSTAKQVDRVVYGNSTKDEIPMQKIACNEFAESQHDWEIIREFEEKGVSGFKVSAENRDAIQDLKETALHNEFDVLLVFMFERLGRIENETPFVLQWFAEHGVEVWSVAVSYMILQGSSRNSRIMLTS